MYIIFSSVTVHMENAIYSVPEDEEVVEVCAVIRSSSTQALCCPLNLSIEFDIFSLNDTAGNFCLCTTKEGISHLFHFNL